MPKIGAAVARRGWLRQLKQGSPPRVGVRLGPVARWRLPDSCLATWPREDESSHENEDATHKSTTHGLTLASVNLSPCAASLSASESAARRYEAD
eukprot:7095397-Pyramimonas_sp.AAC.1